MLEQEIALAAMDMLAERGRQATANGPGWVSALIAGIAPPMVILLVTVGLLAALVARYRSPGILPRPGLIGQALAFGVAATGTIVLLGLAPAEIVDRNVQAWSFTACVFLMPLALLSWIAAHWLRSGPLRLSVPGVLAATLIFYLGIGLVTLVLAFEFILEHLPLPLSVPARVWEGAAARILGDVAKHNQSDVFLAAVQWLLYHGPWITLALWAGLLLGMHWLKMYRGHRQTSPGLGRAKRLGAMVGALGRPALGLATIVLIAYLVVKPAVLHRVEDRFQHDIAMMRDLERSWAVQVEDAIRTLRADKQSMDRLREAAKAKASSTHP